MALLSRPGQPDRQVALTRRPKSELLAEELRRLDPDEIYEAAIRRLARTHKS
jgi:glucose-6-phosphate dehydrogenase assembly protein OpcA